MQWLGLFGKKSITPTGASVRTQFANPGSPLPNLQVMDDSIFRHHEGDLFTPGAENYVFEYPFEYAITSPSGGGGTSQGRFVSGVNQLRLAPIGSMEFGPVNTPFNPLQPPQVYSNPTTVVNGLGGLQAGGIAFYPLIDDDPNALGA